jgi:hypothetical protein
MTVLLRDETPSMQRSPMERFARDCADQLRRRRAELMVQPVGSERKFTVEMFGLLLTGRTIAVSAPANADRSLVAVMPGALLRCRWLNPSTVFQFDAAIKKLVFEPVPMLYLGDLHAIQSRELRGLPRARAALPASLGTPSAVPALVTDLSVSGAQIALAAGPPLAVGQTVELSLQHSLFHREFMLTLNCRIAADQGALDHNHPSVHFYGLVFDAPNENQQLILHGIVQEHLAREADRLGQLLLSEASE